MEGYVVWVDRDDKWHTSHSYVLTQNDEKALLLGRYEIPAKQVWSIPLPNNLPNLNNWFKRQRAIETFRNKALTLAQRDFKEHIIAP